MSLLDYLKASKDALKNLLSKPDTVLYPYDHVPLPDNYRGAPSIENPSDCLLCLKCVRLCPTQALSITELDENSSKFEINLGRCCYCKECEDACVFEAIKLTSEINTAEFDKKVLIRTIIIPKTSKKKKKSKDVE